MVRSAEDVGAGSSGGAGTILLVEDNPAYIRLVRELLQEAGLDGFELEWADLLEKGLDRLDAGSVDLVLLDLLLPDNMGTNTLEVVLERGPDVPVVVLTGIDDDELARDALDMGAVDYLCKGRLDADRLARSVRYALDADAPAQPPDGNADPSKARRMLPAIADRLASAAACLDAIGEHLDPLAPEDARRRLTEEKRRCREMANGLDELLEILGTDAGYERLSLHDVVDDALVRISADGSTGGRVTLTWSEVPQVLGHHGQLVRLFELLLANALEMGEASPTHLEITADRQDESWEIRVLSEGPVPEGPDQLEQVFAAGVDGEGPSGAFTQTYCETVATELGGRLWLEPLDGAFAVCARLPAAPSTGALPPAREERRGRNRKTL